MFTPCHISHVRCQVSGVWCQVSHIKKKNGQRGGASRLRVCYQQGLSRLVFEVLENITKQLKNIMCLETLVAYPAGYHFYDTHVYGHVSSSYYTLYNHFLKYCS